jgi:hypothetical protein
MKKILFAICLSVLFLNSCKEGTDEIGLNTMPYSDDIAFKVDTFLLQTNTVTVDDGIFFNNTIFSIGNYENEKFGNTTASLLAQVIYPQENLTFPGDATPANMKLVIYYSSITNKNAITFDVYEMSKMLEFQGKYYTNINLDEYTDYTNKLGSKTITEEELTNAENIFNDKKKAFFELDFGADFATKFMSDPSIYANETAFLNFFKGISIIPNGGTNMLQVDSVDLYLTYTYGDNESDTLRFPSNIEVRQVNAFSHELLNEKLAEKPNDKEYIYSPAGFFTKVNIPIKSIIAKTNPDKKTSLNKARITLNAEKQEGIPLPSYLLLIKQSDMKDFFEKNRIPDNSKNSFYAKLNADEDNNVYTYTFDLTNTIQEKIKDNSNVEFEEMLLIPITVTIINGAMNSCINSNTLGIAVINNKNNESLPLNLTVIYNEFFMTNE